METTTTATSATSDSDDATTSSTGHMKVGKHVCPEEFLNSFTPMEFEEVSKPYAGVEWVVFLMLCIGHQRDYYCT